MTETTIRTKHTPGPWHRNIKPAKKYCTIFAGRNKHICYLDGQVMSDAEAEANIDLIAAAPELLEALKACLPHITANGEKYCRDKSLTAIAKAEGRQ